MREIFASSVLSKSGLPYVYGANGPNAYDCSGLVCAGLRSIWNDYPDRNCAMLLDYYKDKHVEPSQIKIGCLVFYANGSHVVAVTRDFGGGRFLLTGANGGDPQCLTLETAIAKNALVSSYFFRVIDNEYLGFWHTGFFCAVDPFMGVEA